MSNRRASEGAGFVFCAIGRRARLVSEGNAERLIATSRAVITRKLDFNAGGHGFAALQYADDLDLQEALPGDWRSLTLPEFITALDLSAAARSALCARIVQLLATTFALRRDPELLRQLDAVAHQDGLASGRLRLHKIKDVDTVICETASRLRLVEDGIVVCLSDPLATGVVAAVMESADIRQTKRLAVIDYGASPSAGSALAILPDGLVHVEIDIVESDHVQAFVERYRYALPEAINLAELWDMDFGGDVAAAGAALERVDCVHLPAFGFHLGITDIVSMAHGVLVCGSIVDPESLLSSLTIIDHSLETNEPLSRARLADIDPLPGSGARARRFTSFLPRREPARVATNVALRVELASGESRLLQIPATRNGLAMTRRNMLGCLARSRLPCSDIAETFIPALGPVHARLVERQRVRETVDFGSASSRKAAVVVPLFRETGFIRSQLMAFSADTRFRKTCQIVYVVDDPGIASTVRAYLGGATPVFGLDVTLVTMEENGGYALASNAGAMAAGGDFLVLMNSDVVPLHGGWVDALASRHATLPRFSAVGPKLLYADGSLQHAGMYFERGSDGAWQNNHYFKGFGSAFPRANVERDVVALTGALLALDRADFLEAGGFDTDYIIGDFEDSDLCLNLRARGGRCRYVPSISLHHYERQSISSEKADWATGTTLYNQALYNRRWADEIEKLDFGSDPLDRGLS